MLSEKRKSRNVAQLSSNSSHQFHHLLERISYRWFEENIQSSYQWSLPNAIPLTIPLGVGGEEEALPLLLSINLAKRTKTSHSPHWKRIVNTVDAPDLYHLITDIMSRKRESDRESLDNESIKKESNGKNAKLGSEPAFLNVCTDNARWRSDRSKSGSNVGKTDRDSVSQMNGKQDVSSN